MVNLLVIVRCIKMDKKILWETLDVFKRVEVEPIARVRLQIYIEHL